VPGIFLGIQSQAQPVCRPLGKMYEKVYKQSVYGLFTGFQFFNQQIDSRVFVRAGTNGLAKGLV
jgi:hypothetical protein